MRELLVVLVGKTAIIAWGGAAYWIMSKLHAPGWLTGMLVIAAIVAGFWAYLKLQEIRESAEREEETAKQMAKWQDLYCALAKQHEAEYIDKPRRD